MILFLLSIIKFAKNGMYIPQYDSPEIQNLFFEKVGNLANHFLNAYTPSLAVFSSLKT